MVRQILGDKWFTDSLFDPNPSNGEGIMTQNSDFSLEQVDTIESIREKMGFLGSLLQLLKTERLWQSMVSAIETGMHSYR